MHPKFALLRDRFLQEASTIPLRKFCARPVVRGQQPEYGDSEIQAIKTGTLKNGYLDLDDAQTVNEAFYARVKRRAGARKNDILVACTGVGSLGKVDLYDRDDPAMVDGHIAIVRLSSAAYEPELIVQLMRHRLVQWQIEQALTGATNQTEVYADQIESLLLPVLPEARRAELFAAIQRIDSETALLRGALRSEADVIDEILCAALNYPLREHRERENVRHFSAKLSDLTSSWGLRSSTRYHHPDFKLQYDFFASQAHAVAVKGLVMVPIRLGATATKDDLVEDGEAYYVHPAATRKQTVVDLADCHQVSAEYYEKLKRRFSLAPGDVLLNRSGEGTIGKCGIWDGDELGVFSDFTMRLRFDETRVSRRYMWYFLRSVMFQSQIAREKRGMGNMTNVFPPEVGRMLVVECAREKQDELARAIASELSVLAESRARLLERKREIQGLIEAAISGGPMG